MDFVVQKNTLKLLRQIADSRNVTVPVIPYKPQKAAFDPSAGVFMPFTRKAPEAVGISSEHLCGFLSDLVNDRTLDMHSVMILRNGAVLSEASFGAYKTGVWHITHSLCKSITGLAIGMLIDDGRLTLDTPLVNIFEKNGLNLTALTHRSLTVRHLLTMSSGILFNEAGCVTDEDWVKCFFESIIKFEPGKHFSYNSMNSYMLSAVVSHITGKSLSEFLEERLFESLGIKNICWETCPKGIEKGGWGLYMLPEDMAKIGHLYLQDGVWNGIRIISGEWIKASTQNIMKTQEDFGDFDYGYHIWAGKNQRVFLFNGMFGQNVIGFPDTGVLIVTNAGNDEIFQQSTFFALLKKYFGPDFTPPETLPRNPSAERRLRNLESGLGRPAFPLLSRIFGISSALPNQCGELTGKTFSIDGKLNSVGLLPLITQIIQNNYASGLKGVSFSVENGGFFINFIENGAAYKLPVGFSEAKYETLDIRGEPYMVGVFGGFAKNEDGHTVLKLRISFIETANSRMIKFTFKGDGVKMEFTEQPGLEQIKIFISSVENSTGKLFQSLFAKFDNDYIDYRLKLIFEPVLAGKLDKGDTASQGGLLDSPKREHLRAKAHRHT